MLFVNETTHLNRARMHFLSGKNRVLGRMGGSESKAGITPMVRENCPEGVQSYKDHGVHEEAVVRSCYGKAIYLSLGSTN